MFFPTMTLSQVAYPNHYLVSLTFDLIKPEVAGAETNQQSTHETL